MVRRMLRHLRLNTVAYIALFVALGGTSFAAVQAKLPRNSVGTLQVINGSLLKKDFKANQLPKGAAGPAGAAGAAGSAGATGPAGAAGATNVTVRETSSSASGSVGGSVSCNAGEKVVGGGAAIIGGNSLDQLQQSAPIANGWSALAYNGAVRTLKIFVICAAP